MLFRGSGGGLAWTADLEAAWAPADAELNALRERIKENQRVEVAKDPKASKRPKRSTERGQAQLRIVATLTKHHNYSNGSCLNLEPMGNNELAREAEVSTSTASAFFTAKFKGYGKYRMVCRDPGKLAYSLKALNGEFSPYHLYGCRPANEHGSDEHE
jgi:hypothetical protein